MVAYCCRWSSRGQWSHTDALLSLLSHFHLPRLHYPRFLFLGCIIHSSSLLLSHSPPSPFFVSLSLSLSVCSLFTLVLEEIQLHSDDTELGETP